MQTNYEIEYFGCSDVGVEDPKNGFANVTGETYKNNIQSGTFRCLCTGTQ